MCTFPYFQKVVWCEGIYAGLYEFSKLTIKVTIIDTDRVATQNFGSVIDSLMDSFRMNICKGRLIKRINNRIIVNMKKYPTTTMVIYLEGNRVSKQ